jgi:uncharacterized repeat protein (TIGR01451 family)
MVKCATSIFFDISNTNFAIIAPAPVLAISKTADPTPNTAVVPGQAIAYTISVTNAGSLAGTVTVTDTFAAPLTNALCGATPGDLDETLNLGVDESATFACTAEVDPTLAVELSHTADQTAVAPGTAVTYTVAITNTGNTQNSFALDVLSSDWATTLPTDTIHLAANETTTFAVGVTVPLTAADGQFDTAVIRAASGTVSDTVSLTTTAVVNVVYGVQLSADEAQSGTVGTAVTYTVAITNTGNVQNSFALAQTGGAWAAALSETNILLDAEASTTFEVVVTVPLTAADGQFDTAVLQATGNGGVTATVSLTTTAIVVEPPPTYGAQLSADTPAQSGDAGTTITYTLHLTNTGDVQDTFNLSVAGVWTADLSTTSIMLGAGSSAQFTVVVNIPANATNGQNDVATVTATSQTANTATDTAQLTTTAEVSPPSNPTIYLPLITR